MLKRRIQVQFQCILETHRQNGMEQFGYSKGYKYPHDFPGHVVEQQYLPDKMLNTKYYIEDENCKKID